MRKFNNVNELVNELKPANPVYCIRPESIRKACNWFIKNFPGKTLYAVKTNPNETVIKEIKDPDQRNYFVSNKKLEKKGFKAKISLEDGINELVNIFYNDSKKIKNNY